MMDKIQRNLYLDIASAEVMEQAYFLHADAHHKGVVMKHCHGMPIHQSGKICNNVNF